MHKKLQSAPSSPKFLNSIPVCSFTNQMNYKERANILFGKLQTYKTNLENEKYQKFSEVLQQLKSIEKRLEQTQTEKQQHFNKVMATINQIDKELNHQTTEYSRFKKIFDNLADNTNRECQAIFDKMEKESQNHQLAISKCIDFKIQSFFLKNKGIWTQQDLFNFQPFKEQFIYIKKVVEQFYKVQQKELGKLKKQTAETIEKQKTFLVNEMKRTDHEDIMSGIQSIYSEISKRISLMCQKREQVQKNVLSMIANIIDSYAIDSNKFK